MKLAAAHEISMQLGTGTSWIFHRCMPFCRAPTVGNSTHKDGYYSVRASLSSVVTLSLDLDEECLDDGLSSPVANTFKFFCSLTLVYFLLRRHMLRWNGQRRKRSGNNLSYILYKNVSSFMLAIFIFIKRTTRKGAWVSQPWDLILSCNIDTLG